MAVSRGLFGMDATASLLNPAQLIWGELHAESWSFVQ